MSEICFEDFDYEAIEETWGDDAKLHIGLPIILNNSPTPLPIYLLPWCP